MKDLSKLTPGNLIKTAVQDMKISINQGLKIDMDAWIKHNIESGKICSVCFAGSVMLQKGDDILKSMSPNGKIDMISFSTSLFPKEYGALDEIRRGNIEQFFDILGYKPKVQTESRRCGSVDLDIYSQNKLNFRLIKFEPYKGEGDEQRFINQMLNVAELVDYIYNIYYK